MSEAVGKSSRVAMPRHTSAALGRLTPSAFAIACGVVAAVGLFLATATLVIRGGEVVGPHLSLLSHYLPGYSVSWGGSVVGVAYGLAIGFIGGFVFAVLRNVAVALYLRFVWTRFQHHVANDLLDRMS